MKRILNTLILSAFLMLAFSCQENELLQVDMNESIVLDLSSGQTKAVSEGAEALVNHLDVFIFKAIQSGSGYTQGEKVYYGRYGVNNAPSITLDVKRSSFSEDDRFYVYLIANAGYSKDEMEAKVSTYNDLQTLKQEDAYIHFTGITGLSVDAPEFFLMDALATQKGTGNSPVQLFNGVPSDNTELDAVLKRAAAKIMIKITAGENIDFNSFTGDLESDGGKYYIRNLPYDTFLISGVDASTIEAKRRTTMAGASRYFGWQPESSPKSVTLTAYVYPHHWTNESLLDDETCVIMNLPMIYKKGTADQVDYKNSWYKIHMSDDQMFERNKYYHVNINLNAPGATSDSNPQQIEGIVYAVEEWTSVEVEVGGENRPNYLQLNTSHVDMYNVNTDATTLKFASSSYIKSITLKEAYYFNSTDTKINLNTSENSLDRTVYGQIKATYPANTLNGSITIFSPFVKEGTTIGDSHKNTIRYLTFEVESVGGLKEEFTVAQYPTLYITNEHGLYSYRYDFLKNNALGVTWIWSTETSQWDYEQSAADGSFFASKVAVADGNSYSIRYASHWNNGRLVASNNELNMFNNPRMYHIHITATSKEYIVAKPELDENGYTAMTAENSRLVSPSFLIASQLGATETGGGGGSVGGWPGFGGGWPGSGGGTQAPAIDIEKAVRHCREYIEVSGSTVYEDWRLPTKAEIDIIRSHQHSSPAMAEVLNGSHYYCAYNPEYETNTGGGWQASWVYTVRDIGSSGSVHVRCVHDAYGNVE